MRFFFTVEIADKTKSSEKQLFSFFFTKFTFSFFFFILNFEKKFNVSNFKANKKNLFYFKKASSRKSLIKIIYTINNA